MINQTISHYKVLEKLGEGGMGVVYKAQDLKLERIVALKFLPSHVSLDEGTKARFLQEAKAAAALNHAHICTVYGIEESGGTMFIVMEYVDGGTLQSRLPFASVEQVIDVATEIAEALQEAHAKGIVHRDIKADNIMLTSKGQAKVMDFGLAKLKGSLKLTRTSSTVGTLAYMAPEQIQGGEVDSRSDIFSFGALLFEMLTGKTPFRGEHEAAMVYSIVNEEPFPLEQFRQDTSPLLQNLILKCLEKDPADRYQHMDDLVSELRRTRKKTSRVVRSSAYIPTQPERQAPPSGVTSATDLPTVPAPTVRSRSRMVLLASVGVLVTVAFVVGWLLFSGKGLSVNPNMTARVLTVPFTQYSYPSLSPDGKWIAFPAADANGKWDVYYMHVNGGEPRRITSDKTWFIQQTASISPDGSQIVYDRPNEDDTSYDLFAISSLGGTSRKLAEGASSAQWRPDGECVGFIRTTNRRYKGTSEYSEFWTVKPDGSNLRQEYVDSLFVTKGGSFRFNFCWAPDGRSIAWIRSLSTFSQVLVVRELESGVERLLTDGNENLDAMAWTKDEKIIFSSNRGGNTNLWVIPASGGEAVQLTKGGGPDIGLSISASGNELVYLQQQRVGYLWTANIDGSALRQISFDEREAWEPSFSPDKKRIAFVMNDPDPLTEKSDVYIVDRDGNNRRRLTNGNPLTRLPVWSADGRRIMYSVPPTGQGSDTNKTKIYVVDADDPGVPKLAGENYGLLWMDNDHLIALDGVRSYVVTVSSGTTRRFFTDSLSVWAFQEGRHLAYYDRRPTTRGWWVAQLQPESLDALLRQDEEIIMPRLAGPARKVSSAPSFLSTWTSRTSDAGEVLQYVGEDKVRRISLLSGTEQVLPARFPGIISRSIEMSKDGKEVVFATPRLSSRLVLLEQVFE